MKKNILLVQSFLALPLLTSSFVFAMDLEKQKPTYAEATTGTQLPLTPKQSNLKSSGPHGRTIKKQRRTHSQKLEQNQVEKIISHEQAPEQSAPQAAPQTTAPIIAITEDYTPEDSSTRQNSVVIHEASSAPQITEEAETITLPPLPERKVTAKKEKPAIDYLSSEDKKFAEYDLSQAKYNQTAELQEIINAIHALSSPDSKKLNPIETVEKSTLETYYPHQQDTNAFAKSTVGLKPEARGFNLLGMISKRFNGDKQEVINLLAGNTFEIDNQDHLMLLDKVVTECVDTHDMKSLLLIAQECEKNYPSIRFSDTTSLFQSLSETYKKQIQASELALKLHNQEYAIEFNKKSAELKEQIIQLSNAHKAMTTNFVQAYSTKIEEEQKKIEELRKMIVNTSVLFDRQNGLKKVTLFAKNQVTVPAGSVASVEPKANQKLSSLVTNSNLPFIEAAPVILK